MQNVRPICSFSEYNSRYAVYYQGHMKNRKSKVIDMRKNVKLLKNASLSRDILKGLSKNRNNKSLPSKYFYDARGSKIFEKIMELDEYYPARLESEILEKSKKKIAKLTAGQRFNLIELGAGDGRKTSILIKEFIKSKLAFNYLPIDISKSAITNLIKTLKRQFPNLSVTGIIAEYDDGLEYVKKNSVSRNVVLFLGSNIGNLTADETNSFLKNVRKSLNVGDYLIIGFDLKKDPRILQKAYDDPKGVTRDFNLNLLRRINHELGGNFNMNQFLHHEIYNPLTGAMESYLVSRKIQSVYIKKLNKTFMFDAWEPIHTEYSFKYTSRQIETLAAKNGFKVVMHCYDRRRFFADSIWKLK